MGNCGAVVRSQAIQDDLKHSWYFRIWALLWLLCAVLVFSALIILGGRSSEMQKEPSWRPWIKKVDEIEFPSFTVQTMPNETFDFIFTKQCTYSPNGQHSLLIPTSACDGESEAQCTLFDAAEVYATPTNNRISCEFNITSPVGTDRTLLFTAVQTAENSQTPELYIQPTANAQITVQPTITKETGKKAETHWDIRLNYKSSIIENEFFIIEIVVGNFNVFHFEEDAWYDGWMSAGEIGGFAFFLYILHTMAMLIVGIFLENNSTFLAGSTERSKYANIPDDRS